VNVLGLDLTESCFRICHDTQSGKEDWHKVLKSAM